MGKVVLFVLDARITQREVIRRLTAVSSTGIAPSRGSHATAPIACDGSELARLGLPPTVAGREYHCPRCRSLPRREPPGAHSRLESLSAAGQVMAQPLKWLMLITIAAGMCLMNVYLVVSGIFAQKSSSELLGEYPLCFIL